ncbi:hypothetical protein QYM36_007463 [Artemia franciscana]|uniref:Reverse transcriptase domain-containing protein n=1 Tax=Artemia franciscana TaxID=6661 RepID=A0AA88IE58_ARTSF|nr:hypothetical protein QYM36_007463 [Artemia franciscana]
MEHTDNMKKIITSSVTTSRLKIRTVDTNNAENQRLSQELVVTRKELSEANRRIRYTETEAKRTNLIIYNLGQRDPPLPTLKEEVLLYLNTRISSLELHSSEIKDVFRMSDIVEFLGEKWAPATKLGNRTISALLFTDDMAVVSTTASELKILIDLMAEYLESKKLRLNLKKTEIMIFNKGGRRNPVENKKFRFKGQQIKVVDKAKYMGFTLTPNCS